MNEKLKIKVTIGDRVYPLTIKGEGEEEGVRKAVKKINDLIKKFEENYEVRDKQDVLAMCALQFASLQEVRSIYNEQDAEQIENKLKQMSILLDTHL
ncbi:MAG: cell division protein ZapA [Flavobacteriaceae bacterium]|jgi:cell division protein ZapA|nr:cell division protein ZapA [Flavobacteriaceae bacterium]